MEPRLTTSQQWTPFPEELNQQILEAFNTFFDEYDLEERHFIVEGNIYPSEIVLRVGLARAGHIRQHNFEASLEFKADKQNALTAIHTVIDFLGQTWQDYLEEPTELEELPTEWKETDFEKHKIFLRYSSVNTELEKQADALLNGGEKQLVYEADGESESELQVKQVLAQLTEDPEDDFPTEEQLLQ